MPVSYTHLDVYKRQDLKKGIVFSDELDPDDFLKRMMDTGYPYKWKESVIEG